MASARLTLGPTALLAAAFLALSAAGAAAAPAYVVSTVNLRAAPDVNSEVLARIPGGSRIEVRACSGGWCAVNWHGKYGFAIKTALAGGRAPSRVAVYVERPGSGPGEEGVDPDPTYFAAPEWTDDQRPVVYYGRRPNYGYSRLWPYRAWPYWSGRWRTDTRPW